MDKKAVAEQRVTHETGWESTLCKSPKKQPVGTTSLRTTLHAQHVKERAQDDMGEQFATKQFMERHDNVTLGVMDKQDRSSADKYLREVSRLSVG